MKMFKKLLGAAAIAAVVATASVAPANAALKIELSTNGGGYVPVAESLINKGAAHVDMFYGETATLVLTLIGQKSSGGGFLMDTGVKAGNFSDSTIDNFSVRFTQTDINLAGPAIFNGYFSNTHTLTPLAGISRSLFLDTTNKGLLTTLLASTSERNFDLGIQSASQLLAGQFSLTEQVDFTNVKGSTYSLDDKVTVPEPGTVALMIAALLAMLGFDILRRRSAH